MAADKKISELASASAINGTDRSILVSGDTDYQFTFTLLLQYLNSSLSFGAAISFGTVTPLNTTGKNGDLFIKTSTGQFIQKLTGVWTVVFTVPTSGAADGTVLYGNTPPAAGVGKDQDTYINTVTGIFYNKSGGSWSQVFSMQTGPAGPQGPAGTNGTNGANGKTILSGTLPPSNLTDGTNGDFYLDTNSYLLYGPKASGVWPAGVSLIGDYYSQEIKKLSGSANPIVINNWQVDYQPVLGNRPNILICQKISDDGDGNPVEIDRTDLRPMRYYSDSPANTTLTSIKIDTLDGDTLKGDYIIKFNK